MQPVYVENVYYKEFLIKVDIHSLDKTAEDVADALNEKGMKASVQLVRYVKLNGGRRIRQE